MLHGKVKFFNAKKGFGFIEREGEKDIFVHYSGISMEGYKKLEQNVEVTFDLEDGPNGRQAANVTVVENKD